MYSIEFTKDSNESLWHTMVKSVQYISEKYNVTHPVELQNLVEQEFNIKIHQKTYGSDSLNHITVIFQDEKSYLEFLLRWS